MQIMYMYVVDYILLHISSFRKCKTIRKSAWSSFCFSGACAGPSQHCEPNYLLLKAHGVQSVIAHEKSWQKHFRPNSPSYRDILLCFDLATKGWTIGRKSA